MVFLLLFSVMQKLLLFLTVSLCCGCSSGDTKNDEISAGEAAELIQALSIDTITLRPEGYSGEGFLRAREDKLYFFDVTLSKVSTFNEAGDFLEAGLGLGEGPTEIPGQFIWHTFNSVGEHVFMGRMSDLYRYSQDYSQQARVTFARPAKKQVYRGYADGDLGMYSFDLVLGREKGASNTLALDSKGMLYVPLRILTRTNRGFNMYKAAYYEKSLSLGVISWQGAVFERGFGEWPAAYDQQLLPHLDDRFVMVKQDSIYVGYNASPLIQVYSPYPDLELQYSFGMKGSSIDDDYRSIRSQQDLAEYTTTRGRYTHLHYDSESNLVFRSYIKTKSPETRAGLQIYRDGQLLADVPTPPHFNVIGKIGEFYYADGNQDEANDLLQVYRFRFH